MFKFSLPYITVHFDLLNKKYFEGKLPTPKFSFSTRMKNTIGYVKKVWNKNKYEIKLSSLVAFKDEKVRESTLIHEMIHLWQHENNKMDRDNGGHGKHFNQKIEEFSLLGIDISRYIDENTYFLDDDRKLDVIVVYTEEDTKAFKAFKYKEIDDNIIKYLTKTICYKMIRLYTVPVNKLNGTVSRKLDFSKWKYCEKDIAIIEKEGTLVNERIR
jgi:hypothetical protein